jgi:hypothetical protein
MHAAINYQGQDCPGHTLTARMAMFARDPVETGDELIHNLI